MRLAPRLHLSESKFELYENVTLWHNARSYPTRIVQRWYNPDEECWLYRVYGSEQLFTADSLEPRLEAVG